MSPHSSHCRHLAVSFSNSLLSSIALPVFLALAHHSEISDSSLNASCECHKILHMRVMSVLPRLLKAVGDNKHPRLQGSVAVGAALCKKQHNLGWGSFSASSSKGVADGVL